jgi:hypothetical protein
MKLAARVQGVGLVGPGLASWEAARPILAGDSPYAPQPTVVPSPEVLPATERRRAGKCVRLALGAGLAAAASAGRPAKELAAIFASATGDGENLHAICEALASDDRLISPTRFHNSVHNAPSGYWGIATGAMAGADSLAAYDGSFSAGLLEAVGRLAQRPAQGVLLVAYEAPYPEPLHALRPFAEAFAVGLVLDAERGTPITVETTREAPQAMASRDLEPLRRGVPAARALPLLAQLASGSPGRVVIEYLDGLSLAVEVGA